MFPKNLVLLILGVAALPFCHAGQYTVVGGSIVRPQSEYVAAVSWVDDGGAPGSMLLELAGAGYKEAQSLTLQPDTTNLVTFKTGALSPGDYSLMVRSTAGDPFRASVPLTFHNKTYCVFVHTDKTVYQPGDVLHFRLLALNMHLKPLPNQKPQLMLKDGNGNIVRQWGSVPLSKGVFSDEVQIAEFPALGDWTFEVELQGQTYVSRVFVADYVLPKFNLHIDVAEHIYFTDQKFTVTVTAEQFSGQAMNGELTVSAYPVFYSRVIQPIFTAPVRRVLPILGRASVELDIGAELGLGPAAGDARLVIVEAAVEEALTARRHNVSTVTHLHRGRYAMDKHVPMFYKPGLPYTMQVHISQWEELSRKDSGSVSIQYTFSGEGESSDNGVETQHSLDHEGRLQYTFYPQPVSNQSTMTIQIMYADLKEKVVDIRSSYSPSANYIQATIFTATPRVNEEVTAQVNCTEPLQSFSYYVLGRGGVIQARTVKVAPSRRVADLKFQATQAMSPEGTLIVSYITSSGHVMSSSLLFKVDGVFQNEVEVRLSPENPEPQGSLDISVKAAPDSYVALMASAPSPDFSIASDHHYAAGEGNGLNAKQVLSELRSFSVNQNALEHPHEEIGGSSAGDTFRKSGAVIMTNNMINFRLGGNGDVNPFAESSTRPPLAGPYAFSRLPAPPAPRLHLGKLPTPTWLFTNITLGGEGKGLVGRRVSSEAGEEWSVGAWGVHTTRGLGLAQAAKARPRRRLLRAAAPARLQKGETLALPATVTNPSLSQEISVEITLHNTQQEFSFEDTSNDVSAPPKLELYRRKRVTVPPGRSATAVFLISFTNGAFPRSVTLQLSASGPAVSEKIQLDIKITPNGEEESIQTAELLDMLGGSAKANLSLEAVAGRGPRGRQVWGVEVAQAGAAGSLLAPALERLPSLLDTPPASGYHNMLPFMAAALLLQALQNSGQSSEAVTSQGVQLMQKVYQQQLAYRQTDGSFSLRNQQNQDGSVWVTSQTAGCLGLGLHQAGAGVQASVVQGALGWLAGRQQADGHWSEGATVPKEDALQQSDLVLTAITLQTFIDAKRIAGEEYVNVISKAQDWLARQVTAAEAEGAAVLAPVAAALHAARHPAALQATHLLTAMAKSEDGHRWWDAKSPEDRNPRRSRGRGGAGVWAGSWGVRALLGQGLLPEALQAARALLASTDEAPLATLPALLALQERLPAKTNAQLQFSCPDPSDNTLFSVNEQNSLFVQRKQVLGRQCTVHGEGSGVALASLRVMRQTNVTAPWPRFTLDPRVDTISTAHHLQLTICIGFVALPGEEMSGPVLLDLRLPSGFDLDLDLPSLLAGGFVRSARSDGGSLRLVLSPLTRRERCTTLRASRLHTVANERPGVISLQDLSDNSRRARVFFNSGAGSLCAICSGSQCGEVCGAAERQRAAEGSAGSQRAGRSTAHKMEHFIVAHIALIVLAMLLK